MEKFELSKSLAALRKDLEAVIAEGKDSPVKFLIDDVALDFQVVAASEAGAGGGVKWWVLSAEAKGSVSEATTQKLSVRLKVVGEDGTEPIPMKGD